LDWSIQMLEAALRWQLSPEWSTFLNYTYTDAKIETGPESGLQLAWFPTGGTVRYYINLGAGRLIYLLVTIVVRRAFLIILTIVLQISHRRFLNLDLGLNSAV